MLSTFNMYTITKAYLPGSSLPLATKALGWRSAATLLGCFHKGVMGSDMFFSLLEPQGVGNKGTIRSSIWEVVARFGTLNSKIPSLSNVA